MQCALCTWGGSCVAHVPMQCHISPICSVFPHHMKGSQRLGDHIHRTSCLCSLLLLPVCTRHGFYTTISIALHFILSHRARWRSMRPPASWQRKKQQANGVLLRSDSLVWWAEQVAFHVNMIDFDVQFSSFHCWLALVVSCGTSQSVPTMLVLCLAGYSVCISLWCLAQGTKLTVGVYLFKYPLFVPVTVFSCGMALFFFILGERCYQQDQGRRQYGCRGALGQPESGRSSEALCKSGSWYAANMK